MRVKTKFDLGQRVWFVYTESKRTSCTACGSTEKLEYEWAIRGPETIESITLNGTGNDSYPPIQYYGDCSKFLGKGEQDVFANKSEARKEAARRNRELAR
jgi:hypothetical protein